MVGDTIVIQSYSNTGDKRVSFRLSMVAYNGQMCHHFKQVENVDSVWVTRTTVRDELNKILGPQLHMVAKPR